MARITSEQFVSSIDEINRPGRQPGIYINLDPDVLDRLVSCAENKELEIGIPVDPATLASYLIQQGLERVVSSKPSVNEAKFLLDSEAEGGANKSSLVKHPAASTAADDLAKANTRLSHSQKVLRRMSIMSDEEIQQYYARRHQP
jgi:hypothetical protein